MDEGVSVRGVVYGGVDGAMIGVSLPPPVTWALTIGVLVGVLAATAVHLTLTKR